MAGIQDLIDIQFQDLTGYAENNNDDVLGTLFTHFWGPKTSEPRVYNRQAFMQAFPAYLPYNPDGLNHSILDYMSLKALRSYAQILKAFDLGIGSVEVRNVNGLDRYVIASNLSAPSGWMSDATIEGANWALALKYAGLVPSSLIEEGLLGFKIVPGTQGLYTLYVGIGNMVEGSFVLNENTDVILEQFEGSFVPNTIVDGQDVYFGTLLENSNFLMYWAKDTWEGTQTLVETTIRYSMPSGTAPLCDIPSSLAVTDLAFFEDVEKSQATLLISPFTIVESADISVAESFDAEIYRIAASKKTLNAVTGLHTETLPSSWQVSNAKYFCVRVEGLEYYTVFGKRITLNCVGGWCGATAQIAKDVRLNQAASANLYGGYSGALVKSQSFDKVLEAHKKGIVSIYNSLSGPQIFGVRSYFKNQNTYFAKLNVMRVLASYLKNLIPLMMNAIHTDASANPITRRVLSSQMNSVCDDFIANQNLKPQSYVDLSDDLNNDRDTRGGEVLIAQGVCYFIKLVEQVKFKIIATDSSVDVQLS